MDLIEINIRREQLVEVSIHGHMQVNQELKESIAAKVTHAARLFERQVPRADVELTEERNPRLAGQRVRVEVTTLVAGQIVRVEAQGQDPKEAVDLGVDKLERRLRQLKEKLITRGRSGENKRLNGSPLTAEESEELSSAIEIVRTKRFAMKPMSPQEAALQMQMLGHAFFVFLNADSGHHSVLYRRRDGKLGLIESA